MNFRKVNEIVKFDVKKSIQNKWFVILNIIAFISIIFATNWSNISKYLSSHNLGKINEKYVIQVLDNENLVFENIKKEFEKDVNVEVKKVEKNEYSKENIPKENTLLIEANSDSEKIIKYKIISKEGIDGDFYNKIYDALKKSRSEAFASKNNISIEDLEILNEDLVIDREMLDVDAENSDSKQMIKLVSTVIMYMCLLIVLGRIANEIANEKVSKSIEYVLTSVSAKEYLLAKVLSSTLTIVIQLIYMIIYYMIGNMISSLFVSKTLDTSVGLDLLGNVDRNVVSYIIAMIGYLILTVFLISLIQAALSSKTTSIAEAGNTTMLLIMIVIILYMLSNSLIDPYTKVNTFMYVISCLPIVSMFFVPSMMIIGQATSVQIIVSFVILILSIPLIFNYCAKVFKNGILDYSNKKTKINLFNFRKENKEKLSIRELQEIDLRKSNAKKFAFIIGMAMILFIIFQTLSGLLIGLVLPIFVNESSNSTTILVIENSLILIISLGLSSLFIKILSSDLKFEEKKLSSFEKFEIVFIGITFLVLIQLFVSWLLPKIGIDGGIIERIGLVPENTFKGKLIFVIGMAIVPAIFEEIFFRKWILNICKKYGNLFAILFSAFLFGIYHMNLSQGIFAFLIGILFGIIAIETGGIKYTVLLHFLNNAFASIEMIYGEDSIIFNFLYNLVIAVAIVGGILIIKNIPNLRKLKKENFKISKDCKYLLENYTFVISMILIVVRFVSTEHIL